MAPLLLQLLLLPYQMPSRSESLCVQERASKRMAYV